MRKLAFGMVGIAALVAATPAASQGVYIGPYGVTPVQPGSRYQDYTPGGRYYDDTRPRSGYYDDARPGSRIYDDAWPGRRGRQYSRDSDADADGRCRWTTIRGEGGLVKHVRRCDEPQDRRQKK